jgi:CzcA family heavy metal efflux pump
MTDATPGASGPQALLIRSAIRARGMVVALAMLVAGYGAYSLTRIKYDVFPEFAPPQVSIQTEAPGLAPEQVELLVTRPIETAINGMSGVESLRSASIEGLSVVTVIFGPRSDIYRDRQLVAERLALAAGQLPQGIAAPAMTPLTSSTSTVLIIGLTSGRLSLMDLRTLADWTVRRRLLSVPGVAKVSVFGGEVKSLQIQVHPEALVRFGIGLDEVVAAARRATGTRGAGFVDTANQRLTLNTSGQSLNSEEVGSTVLRANSGGSLTLGDVATVAAAPEPRVSGATIMGRPGVMVMIGQQFGSNTVEVTRRIEAALDELNPSLERAGAKLDGNLFRPANFIATALGSVESALLLGALLVVVVLLLFLFDLRSAAVCGVAIPLSLLAAVLALQWLGATLNTLTLGGLAIAIGEVVDDAVIGVENITRRLRENKRLASPRPAARVVLDACIEVRSAVVYATFAVLLVFFPVMALSGVAGSLFAPLAIAYIVAVLASLVVALTVVPALAMALLGHRAGAVPDPPLVTWSKRGYEALLGRVDRRPRLIIASATILTLASAATLPFLGGDFLPELKEGHFVLHMTTLPGTSLAESLRLGQRVTAALLEIPAVRSVAQRTGRAEGSEDTLGTHDSEVEVDLKPLGGEAQEEAEAQIRKVLAGFPGASFSLKTFLAERVEETISGFTAAVAVNIFGDSLDVLDRKAQQVAQVLQGVPGAAEVRLISPPGLPQLSIRPRPADLRRWGLSPVDVLDVLRIAYHGDVVGQTYSGDRVLDVVVTLDPVSRSDVTGIGDLPVHARDGHFVALEDIADIYESSGRYEILHQSAQRVATVTADVKGRDAASFVKDAKAQIAAKVGLPPGTYVEFAGAAEAEARSESDLFAASLVAALGVALLVAAIVGNARNLLLVLANLPFAFVGGVAAVWATGGVLSLGSTVGFITLFGITLRNSVIMIARYEHLVAQEGWDWGLDAAVKGAVDRLAPILMTSLVTALGLLPLALGMNEPGREIEGPMAVVILGGLITSMVLNLLILPTLALRFGRFAPLRDEFARST